MINYLIIVIVLSNMNVVCVQLSVRIYDKGIWIREIRGQMMNFLVFMIYFNQFIDLQIF